LALGIGGKKKKSCGCGACPRITSSMKENMIMIII
jgi:hypothetical protein